MYLPAEPTTTASANNSTSQMRRTLPPYRQNQLQPSGVPIAFRNANGHGCDDTKSFGGNCPNEACSRAFEIVSSLGSASPPGLALGIFDMQQDGAHQPGGCVAVIMIPHAPLQMGPKMLLLHISANAVLNNRGGCWGRAWNWRMMVMTDSPVRSSISPLETSSTTETCSLTMRKKSTAPGVQSCPSSFCFGSPPKSACACQHSSLSGALPERRSQSQLRKGNYQFWPLLISPSCWSYQRSNTSL